MSDEAQDARWQQILEARADLADEPVPLRAVGSDEPVPPRQVGSDEPLPLRETGPERRTRRSSRKGMQFDEALSGLGSWSTLEEPRRRLSA